MNDALTNSLSRHYSKQEQTEELAYVSAADIVDPFGGKWLEHVAAAKAAWSLIGENELVRSGGCRQTLAWLLQGRYTMSPPDAKQQVDNFMLKQLSA